jgi:hypothetical protein
MFHVNNLLSIPFVFKEEPKLKGDHQTPRLSYTWAIHHPWCCFSFVVYISQIKYVVIKHNFFFFSFQRKNITGHKSVQSTCFQLSQSRYNKLYSMYLPILMAVVGPADDITMCLFGYFGAQYLLCVYHSRV